MHMPHTLAPQVIIKINTGNVIQIRTDQRDVTVNVRRDQRREIIHVVTVRRLNIRNTI